MMLFCGTCNKIVGRPHGLGHTMLSISQMTMGQKQNVASQLGAGLAKMVKLNPDLIVLAFRSALEDANQHDFSRIVEKQWKALLKH